MVDRMSEQAKAQWNIWAWFGSVLGSTLWMLLASMFLVGRSTQLAGLILGLFVLANVVGIWLWRSRLRWSVWSAIRGFLVVFWVCAVTAIYAIDRAGHWETLGVGGSNNISVRAAFVLLSIWSQGWC